MAGPLPENLKSVRDGLIPRDAAVDPQALSIVRPGTKKKTWSDIDFGLKRVLVELDGIDVGGGVLAKGRIRHAADLFWFRAGSVERSRLKSAAPVHDRRAESIANGGRSLHYGEN